MSLQKASPCKINLLLNILGKRTDCFHELETVMQPVNVFDELSFSRSAGGIQLSCGDPNLPTDSRNLVFRAAEKFLAAGKISDGVSIHLEKNIPLAAGLGGGSGDAATTLLGLNELFGAPLSLESLEEIAASIGSDVPFFLQTPDRDVKLRPALGTGRGERIELLDFFPALRGAALLLIHPGFGVPTSWAYQALARFPAALNGKRERANELIALLKLGDLKTAGAAFYNALEAPVLEKYPLLALFQDFLRANGATATLMSGSGSTTFALVQQGEATAAELRNKFRRKFGETCWMAVVSV